MLTFNVVAEFYIQILDSVSITVTSLITQENIFIIITPYKMGPYDRYKWSHTLQPPINGLTNGFRWGS